MVKMLYILFLTTALITNVCGKDDNDERRPGAKSVIKYEAMLLRDIFGNYSMNMRPVKSSKEPAKIRFGFKLNKLSFMNIKTQIFSVDAFILMAWNDPQLKWDESQYNDTDDIIIPSYKIWTPDIVLYNMAENTGKSYLSYYNAPVLVKNSGDVMWINSLTLKASCDVDVTWFPFDNQICSLKFGSWSMSKRKLQLSAWEGDDDEKQNSIESMKESNLFYTNGMWNVGGITSKLSEEKFSCCTDKYSQISYDFLLHRMPNFYVMYLVLPCAAIVILTLIAFFIPPESGERIGFGVTVILSLSVYLIVISDKLPEKSNSDPLLAYLYVSIFYILVLSFALSTVTVRLSYSNSPPPKWLYSVVRKLKYSKGCKKRRQAAKVQAFDGESMGDKSSVDLKDSETVTNEIRNDKGKNDEESWKMQWKMIISFLDNLFFIFIVLLIIFCPLVIWMRLRTKNGNKVA